MRTRTICIQALAEHGALFKQAGQRAIQRIGQSGHDKKPEAEQIVPFKDCRHQEGGEANADER